MRIDRKTGKEIWDASDYIFSLIENCASTHLIIMKILANEADLSKADITFLLDYVMKINSEEFYDKHKNMKSYREIGKLD